MPCADLFEHHPVRSIDPVLLGEYSARERALVLWDRTLSGLSQTGNYLTYSGALYKGGEPGCPEQGIYPPRLLH